MMTIRTATMQDLDSIAAVEKVCFRSAEAPSREELEKRLQNYPDHFWLQMDGDRAVIGQNGVVTAAINKKDLTLVG